MVRSFRTPNTVVESDFSRDKTLRIGCVSEGKGDRISTSSMVSPSNDTAC